MSAFSRTIDSTLAEIGVLAEAIDAWAEGLDLPMKTVMETNLMLDELITNIVSYGYQSEAGHPIEVALHLAGDTLTIRLADSGPPFNLLDAAEADTALSLEDRDIGGLGIHFVRKLAQSIAYARENDQNVVTIEKLVPGFG
jgi:anti-sigma regulatory factor (Ser/Thr protein kinase)